MMATFFHGNSEIQGVGDGLQTLILMNPAGYGGGFSDTHQSQPPQQGNFFLLNPTTPGGSTLNPACLLNAPPYHKQQQQFVGIPLQTTAQMNSPAHQDPHPSSVHSQHISALHGVVPRSHFGNMYAPIDLTAARDTSGAQQGLSLSLSSQQHGYGPFRQDREEPSEAVAQPISPISPHNLRVSGGPSSSASGITNGVHGALLGSKYLKAAQQLLDEVVNVGKAAIRGTEIGKEIDGQFKVVGETPAGTGNSGGGETSFKRGVDLSTAERQEIQMKKAKLVNMLDEVEQRYRQYHHQMQMVISWFEQAAGVGSARTYTALALQTISKQFRCLKDTILGQIRAAGKALGEEDSLGGNIEGSRLKSISNQIRQQRALQQLGMIPHNAWRPQRGLPERSVSVLRAWLFEHFLHPYPKDSDKIMLAKQTNLTRSQVSNWFINARVRLWKPMVEEMYREEMKEKEQNGSDDKTSKSTDQNEDASTKSNPLQKKILGSDDQTGSFNQSVPTNTNNIITATFSNSAPTTSSTGIHTQNQSCFNLIGSSEMESCTQGSPKKQRNNDILHSPGNVLLARMGTKSCEANNEHETIKYGNSRQGRDEFTLTGGPTNFMGGFESYPMGEIGRFSAEQFTAAAYSGNGVSLTLGLPHCENLSMPGAHQTFLPNQNIQLGRGIEVVEANEFSSPMSSYSTNVYENINIQNRKRFTAQLLPDFVT